MRMGRVARRLMAVTKTDLFPARVAHKQLHLGQFVAEGVVDEHVVL